MSNLVAFNTSTMLCNPISNPKHFHYSPKPLLFVKQLLPLLFLPQLPEATNLNKFIYYGHFI